ncbi:MAG: transcription antitermination factor NusB [Novosphingobium sp.]
MSRNARALARSAARLAAVQALYQQAMEGTPLVQLLDEFHQHRLGAEIEDERLADAEVSFFDDIVKGVDARRDEIDGLLAERLAAGWTLARLDRTMLQILRAGTYELVARADVPTASAISEYLDVAHAFFDEREAKFANGVLDAVAKAVRS